MEQKALRMGAAVLALALILRLAGNRGWGQKELATALVFFGSGRLVTEAASTPTQPRTETEPQIEEAAVPVFGQLQEPLVQVNASWEVDTLALLQAPLNWSLRAEQPTVLILHSHATESYETDGTYTETSPYRTLDTRHNMVAVGKQVADILEAGGIRVIHDETLHDYPSYNDAYIHARERLGQYLTEYPDICMVLDLHRDAAEDESGKQKREAVNINGISTARLMLVMGSDRGGRSYPNWQENLALAVKLQAQLEEKTPGLCRPIKLVTSRYNQDLSTGALLVEVGTAGNTLEEALSAARLLAEGILALAGGANI